MLQEVAEEIQPVIRTETTERSETHLDTGLADVILTLVLLWLRIHSGDSDKETYSTVYSEVHQSQISMVHV